MVRLLALVSLVTAVMALGAAPAAAQDKAAQDKAAWDKLVADAQREGTVVVKGPPHAELRKNIPAVFKQRYGITVEYLGGRTNEHSRACAPNARPARSPRSTSTWAASSRWRRCSTARTCSSRCAPR